MTVADDLRARVEAIINTAGPGGTSRSETVEALMALHFEARAPSPHKGEPDDPDLAAYASKLRHACAASGFHEHDGCSCSNSDLNEAYTSGRLKLPVRYASPPPMEGMVLEGYTFELRYSDEHWSGRMYSTHLPPENDYRNVHELYAATPNHPEPGADHDRD